LWDVLFPDRGHGLRKLAECEATHKKMLEVLRRIYNSLSLVDRAIAASDQGEPTMTRKRSRSDYYDGPAKVARSSTSASNQLPG
jgi:hypothetical protein